MVHSRRFTPGRITVFLLIVAAILLWDAQKKIPAGPAEGSTLSGAPAATQPTGPTIRVATFNIDGGAEGLDHVAHVLGGFDLAGLEEVHGLDQTDFLGQNLRQPYLYAPVESQWWYKSFGNAAITDLPVTQWERIPISSNDSDSNRNVIFLRATFAGQPLNVLITHIDRKQDHAAEIRDVSGLFLSLQEPAILMGDFNLTEDANGKDNDPDVAALASTPGVIDPIGKAYDRIFARGFTAVESGYIEEHASDHPLAWAELRLAQP
ncbi:MAG: endonuclease/exonuclease/phosphatase family protein [Tepidisphaeraceae bacterium]|jgi:endonuclease/exonuclease/phosphatase family metal-dependent hydrolase